MIGSSVRRGGTPRCRRSARRVVSRRRAGDDGRIGRRGRLFVLSVFVIIGLSGNAHAIGKTRSLAFYGQRSRRILPAATLVIIVTALASYHWLEYHRRRCCVGRAPSGRCCRSAANGGASQQVDRGRQPIFQRLQETLHRTYPERTDREQLVVLPVTLRGIATGRRFEETSSNGMIPSNCTTRQS